METGRSNLRNIVRRFSVINELRNRVTDNTPHVLAYLKSISLMSIRI